MLHEVIGSTGLPAPLVVEGPAVDLAGTIDLDAADPRSVHIGDRYHLIQTAAPLVFTGAFAPTWRASRTRRWWSSVWGSTPW